MPSLHSTALLQDTGIVEYGTTYKSQNDASEAGPSGDGGRTSTESGSSVAGQAGVKTLEAITQTWTSSSLAMAYFGLYLMAVVTSLEGQTTYNYAVFATSAFAQHSLISTVYVVQSVFYSVIKPPMAKLSDVFGRFEAFSVALLFYVLGYILQAASTNVETFASATLFYAAGNTGLQILQQVFVADTTDLVNRALFSSFPDLPYLVTTWVGPIIAQSFLRGPGWRPGYGMWAIVLPVAFLPLALSLFLNKRKAMKLGLLPASPYHGMSVLKILKTLWFQLDIFGLVLLSAAECLVLIPLTLAANAREGWRNPSIVVMLVVGGTCAGIFPFWERSKKLAPMAFFSRELFRSRTVLIGVAIAFFYFMAFYLSVQPYFYSYLLVVQNESVVAAGHITQSFSFTASITSVVVGVLIKFTKHYKYFVTIGAAIYLWGIGLMIRYRSIGTSTFALVTCQMAVGIGGGMLHGPAQLGVQASVSHGEVAAATAVFLSILEIGGAVGSAISGAIWSANVLPRLEQYLPAGSKDDALSIYSQITVAAWRYPPGTPIRDAINRAYQETMHILLLVAFCVATIPLILSLFLDNYKLDRVDQKVKGRVIGGRTNASSFSKPAKPVNTSEDEAAEQLLENPVRLTSRMHGSKRM